MKIILTNLNMLINRLKIFYVLFISLLFMFFTYGMAGFFVSEYEGLNASLLSGSLTPNMAFRSVYFSGNLMISYFYSVLYEYFPSVAWISYLEYFWMYLACALLLYVFLKYLPESYSTKTKILLMVIVYILVIANHHIHLNYTRVAYMVCGSSLITLIGLFTEKSSIKKQWWIFALLNLFFIIGTLIRNEAAIACVFLLFPFGVFLSRSFKKQTLLFAFPIIVVVAQSLFFALDIKIAKSNEYYKQVEPDIEEQFMARGNLSPLSALSSKRDSVIYGLAKELVLSDPKVMTPKVLRSFISKEEFLFTDIIQWNRVFHELKHIYQDYWYLVIITLLLSCVILLQNNRKIKIDFVVFVTSFWLLTIAQTYVDKVNERSWLPYISLFIFCHILLIAKNLNQGISKKIYSIFILCGLLFVLHIFHLKSEANQLKEDLKFRQQEFSELKKIAFNKILVINSSAFDVLFSSNQPFDTFDFSSFKKIYLIDSYIIPFLPYYQQYLEKECNCDLYEYPSFWVFLEKNKKDVVIASTVERMSAIQQYTEIIHHKKLRFHALLPSNRKTNEWNAWEISE